MRDPARLPPAAIQTMYPEEIKKRRLDEIVRLQNRLSLEKNREDLGKTFEVLIEGDSKKSAMTGAAGTVRIRWWSFRKPTILTEKGIMYR